MCETINAGKKEGKMIAGELKEDAIVISGISGRFPDSENVQKLLENIINKRDMTHTFRERWQPLSWLPQGLGTIENIEKFDAGFFGISARQATEMDIQIRHLLEVTYEAIMDAGLSPDELKGSKTGVFIGTNFAEGEKVWFFERTETLNKNFTCTRSMLAQQISYRLGLEGPSFIMDTACAASSTALISACEAIRDGNCENAIVGGSNLCFCPLISLQFAKLGVLSKHGSCRSFDKDGEGYVRSESITIIFLQKAKNARRIYAEYIHGKTNCDGYKENGISFPSGPSQADLLKDTYEEANVDPTEIDYVEAHATATTIGDPQEVHAIDSVICAKREKPLLVGSVKSNIGHAEGASGLCGVIKTILSMENDYILPNDNFTSPKPLKAIEEGRIKIVVKKTPWPKNGTGLVGVNNFGIGGLNSHIVLKRYLKRKRTNFEVMDDVPFLICVSGRTQEAVEAILNDVESRKVNFEYAALLRQVFQGDIKGHLYRGFILKLKEVVIRKSLKFSRYKKSKLWLVFEGHEDLWKDTKTHFIKTEIFQSAIEEIKKILRRNNIDIENNNNNSGKLTMKAFINSIAFVKVCKTLGIVYDKISGSQINKLLKLFNHNSLSLEETVLKSCRFSLDLSKTQKFNMSLDDNFLAYEPFDNNELNTTLTKINSIKIIIGVNSSSNFDSTEIYLPNESNDNSFLCALGKLYEFGFNPKIDKLYPKTEWPVSSRTPMISHLIKWNHSDDWFVPNYFIQTNKKKHYESVTINLKDNDWKFLSGHVVNGRLILPAASYICLVWQTFAKYLGTDIENTKVIFENAKCHKYVSIRNDKPVVLRIGIQKISGKFEISEGGDIIFTGKIKTAMDRSNEMFDGNIPQHHQSEMLNEKEIYKKFQILGFNFSGDFCTVSKANTSATMGYIKWIENWICFIDGIFQIKFLQTDTQKLYAPLAFDSIMIDGKTHKEIAARSNLIAAYAPSETSIVVCGGIEIRGFHVTVGPANRNIEKPILDVCKFVPFNANLMLSESVEINSQMIEENFFSSKIEAIEIVEEDKFAVAPLLQKVFSKKYLIRFDICVLSKAALEMPDIKVKNHDIGEENRRYALVVISNVSQNVQKLEDALRITKNDGFVLLRENVNFDVRSQSPSHLQNLEVLSVHEIGNEKIILLRRSLPFIEPLIININDKELNWLPELQEALKTDRNILLLAQNQPQNGIIGFYNCLRRETGNQRIKCLFLLDETPSFNIYNKLIFDQLKKNLCVNVLRNGQWGSYRYLPLDPDLNVERRNAFMDVLNTGDITSMRLVEGPQPVESPHKKQIHIYYSSLNFKDIVKSSGRISGDILKSNRLNYNEEIGLEFVGRDFSGKRFMGISDGRGFANVINADKNLLWEVPANWTMEDAATVPLIYGTVLHALINIAKIREGENILIHAGAGGVGQAAINVAIYYKCNIFTTVGTEEKIQFIKEKFPSIKDDHIGNSRDTSFEQIILKKTNGKGVDIILNSLSEEKLMTSMRCLGPNGNFLEIGIYDFINNNLMSTKMFNNNRRFHGIYITAMLKDQILHNLINENLKKEIIKPITRTLYNLNELEETFRFMSGGKHIGKIVIKLKEEETIKDVKPTISRMPCLPRYYSNPKNSYIIIGGLGGFGLQLADWLIIRGARKIVLTSRKGISTNYQQHLLNLWLSYGAVVQISTENATTEKSCRKLIRQASHLGPVEAIFNLGLVLKDALLENHSKETFEAALVPKSVLTKVLDKVSREMCPDLKLFVMFSSIFARLGNMGQTNYGLGNSVMERICEGRRKNGYPALAIQWGVVGDVGCVAEALDQEIDVKGMVAQSIASCLKTLDVFLQQNETIVSSMMLEEKWAKERGRNDVFEILKNIFGIKDLQSAYNVRFSELGIDSIISVELRHILETEFNVTLTSKDLRSLTFAKLEKQLNSKNENLNFSPPEQFLKIRSILDFITFPRVESRTHMSMIKLSTSRNNSTCPNVIFFPGGDGTSSPLEFLAKSISFNVYCLQYVFKSELNKSVEVLAESLLPEVEKVMGADNDFIFVAYSYGALIALHLATLLEKSNQRGLIILIDGSITFVKKLWLDLTQQEDPQKFIKDEIIAKLLGLHFSFDEVTKLQALTKRYTNFEECLNEALNILPSVSEISQSKEFLGRVCRSWYSRCVTALQYQPPDIRIKSKVKLLKASNACVPNLSEDHDLKDICENVESFTLEGDHTSILTNPELSKVITNLVRLFTKGNCVDMKINRQ